MTAVPYSRWAQRDAGVWLRRAVPLALVAGAGIVLRVLVYRSALGIPDSDEAVVGLMAREILHGHLTVFFWGQGYGGSQEALLTAPLFLAFGSSLFVLRLVPILLNAAASVIVWRVGRRLSSDRLGIVAGCLFWIWPPYLVFRLTHQWGFYASGLLYAALLLLLALRAVEEPSRVRVGVFGLVAGLAFWDDTQLVPFLAVLVVWVIWRRPVVLRQAWLAIPLAVVGALPWLLWNVHHDFGSFQTHITTDTSYGYRLREYVSPLLPQLLGLRTTFSQAPLLGGVVTNGVYGLLLLAFAYGAYRSRKTDASVLYVIPALFPLVYAISRQTLLSSEPRYLLMLCPVLALLVAQVSTTALRAAAVLALAFAISAVGLHRMNDWMKATPPDPAIAPRNVQPVIRMLDAAGVDRVYAQYWVAYRIDFDTDEHVVAAESQLTSASFVGDHAVVPHSPHIRWVPYEREADAAPRAAFVFIDWLQDQKRPLRLHVMAQLAAHGYTRRRYANLIVYLPPRSL